MFNWAVRDEIIEYNPLSRIKMPKAEKKVVKGLSMDEVNVLINAFGNGYDRKYEHKRNKAILMVLIDCGLRLGELLNLKVTDVNMEQQVMKVSGKTGEHIVRFGSATARALLKYLMARNQVNGHTDTLWPV